MTEDRIFRPTTVGKLIDQLKAFPLEYRVMVRGYELGYDDPEPLEIIQIKVDPIDSSVFGNYEDSHDTDAFVAVLIDRP
jgi:hypothetical protein